MTILKLFLTFSLLNTFSTLVISQEHLNISDSTIVINETSHLEIGYTPIYFNNITTDGIRILNVRSSYGGMIAIWNPEDIPAGAQDSITILIDLENEECQIKRLTFLTQNIVTMEESTTNLNVTWLCDATSTIKMEIAEVKIFPNPTVDYINMENVDAFSKYQVINNEGTLIQSGLLTSRIHLDSSLTAGIYYLILYSKNEVRINKMFKL